jgi:hypothetical protein
MALRGVLRLKTRSLSEYRAAFDRIDLDKSGYIEIGEIEKLLGELYEDGVPAYEVTSFLSLFDTDGDRRISWDEFVGALGGVDDGVGPAEDVDSDERDESAAVRPAISGTVTVKLDEDREVELDAAAYMEQLAAEAQTLRAELTAIKAERTEQQEALSSSIAAYVTSLPEDQLKILSSGISDDVVSAMRQLVEYILRSPSGEGPLAKEATVMMEQEKLQVLCLYQLVLGYRLREAEATGEATDAIGN